MTWIQTFTGKAFDLLDPKPEMVCIEDIAHHLALINRFTGATREPYSVAQHSVLCSWIVPPELALTALLHDAPEAYVTDVPRPLKEAMRKIASAHAGDWSVQDASDYDKVEEYVQAAVGRRFGVELVDLDPRVKHADLVMLATERVHLHSSQQRDWDLGVAPHHDFAQGEIEPWPWREAEIRFLARFISAGGTPCT
jgi:hypothetical protein